MEGGEVLQLCLPPLSGDDPLFSKKMKLLSSRNLSSELQIPMPSSKEEVLRGLDRLVQCARILVLDEVELYFAEDGDSGPFSPRNELESLNSVLSVIDLLSSSSDDGAVEVLRVLKEATVDMIRKVGAQCSEYGISEGSDSKSEELLLKWGKVQGVKTKLKICHFKGAGRGAQALHDIDTGVTALEIPESLIINENLVYESEMFDILKNLDGITAETMMLLWSMKERHNSNSRFKAYFDTLPKEFKTDFEACPDEGSETSNAKSTWTTHMVRGTWMAKNKGPPTYGLPPPLLEHLRSALKDDGSEPIFEICGQVNKETETTVLETILSIFNPMMEGLEGPDDVDRDGTSWDVKLALDVKDLHRKIISSVLASCSVGLQALNSL